MLIVIILVLAENGSGDRLARVMVVYVIRDDVFVIGNSSILVFHWPPVGFISPTRIPPPSNLQ
jgi:hypothetical protein